MVYVVEKSDLESYRIMAISRRFAACLAITVQRRSTILDFAKARRQLNVSSLISNASCKLDSIQRSWLAKRKTFGHTNAIHDPGIS